MYKVFINDSSLELVDSQYKDQHMEEFEDADQLKSILEEIGNDNKVQHRKIRCNDLAAVWETLQKFYQLIEAAGGVVKNPEEEILMIFRLGKWDLPKGKLEDGESPKEGAVREVMEECGLEMLEIIGELPTTYHTYQLNGKSILKRTYWFEMRTGNFNQLIPQTEENIEKVVWVRPEELNAHTENTYASIKWLLDQLML